MVIKKYHFKKIKSTNDQAIKMIKRGLSKGIIITEEQTDGRGQHGNKWISLKGNLFMTIFFEINKKGKMHVRMVKTRVPFLLILEFRFC